MEKISIKLDGKILIILAFALILGFFILFNKVNSEKVYAFLRKAMSLVDKQRPFRGPSSFKDGDFEYLDESEGDAGRFKGTEKIFFKGKEIYRLEYHGGTL